MIQRFINLPIGAKIISTFTLVLFLICSLIFIYFPQRQKKQVTNTLQSKAENTAQILAAVMAFALDKGDYDFFDQISTITKSDPNIVYISIVHEQGKPLISFNPRGIQIPSKESYAGKTTFEERGMLHTTILLQIEEGVQANLIIGYSLRQRDIELAQIRNTGFAISILIFLLGILMFFYLSRLITNPLRKIVDTIKEVIRTGNYQHKVEKSSTDEVGTLIDAFNQMSEKIQTRTIELQQSESRMDAVLNTVGEGIITIDSTNTIVMVNQKVLSIWGYERDELVGKNLQMLMPEKYRAANAEGLQRNVSTGVARVLGQRLEFIGLRKNGSTFPVEIYITETKMGEHLHFTAAVRDITERKQSEEALKQSEEKFRSLFEESKDVVFISTPDGKFLEINPAGVELFGYSSKKELLQANIIHDLYFDPRDREKYEQSMKQVGFVKDYELVLKKKDGQKLFVLTTATPVRDENGKIVAYRGIIHDLTARKQLEEQLLQAQKLETIGTLAGGVAHDFNNLLTVILGCTEFGLQSCDPVDPVYRELLNIEHAAKQAGDFTSQLLTFSRRQNHKPKIVNLNKIISEHMKMLRHIIGEHIELKTNLQNKIAPILADPAQMQQILMNLSVNARDAMPTGGTLIIKTDTAVSNDKASHEKKPLENQPESGETSDTYVEITISDTGTGMDKETESRIFEPFFTTKETGQGTGLGLSVVYGIVKQHNGHIKVDSDLGKGTCIKIAFPAVAESGINEVKAQSSFGPTGNETILVVEDETAVLNVAVRILNGLGYIVLTAKNGLEALKVFKKQADKVDLVILDVVMPKMSGPETFKKLGAIRPNLPVIFVTGYDVHSEIGNLEKSAPGSFSVLQKPYTRNTLAYKIREVLDTT